MRLNVVRTLSRAQKQQGSVEKKRYFCFESFFHVCFFECWRNILSIWIYEVKLFNIWITMWPKSRTHLHLDFELGLFRLSLDSTSLLFAQPSVGEVLGFQTLLLGWSQLLEISFGECAQLRGAENPESKRILCSNISSSGLLEQFFLFCHFRERLKTN